jgi:hypothetical protein
MLFVLWVKHSERPANQFEPTHLFNTHCLMTASNGLKSYAG